MAVWDRRIWDGPVGGEDPVAGLRPVTDAVTDAITDAVTDTSAVLAWKAADLIETDGRLVAR